MMNECTQKMNGPDYQFSHDISDCEDVGCESSNRFHLL